MKANCPSPPSSSHPSSDGQAAASGNFSMAEAQFAFGISVDGDLGVITAAGEMDIASVTAFGAFGDTLLQAPIKRIIVDLRDVTFLDSSGLSSLLELQRRAGDLEVTVQLGCPSKQVKRLLEIAGLGDRLSTATDTEDRV